MELDRRSKHAEAALARRHAVSATGKRSAATTTLQERLGNQAAQLVVAGLQRKPSVSAPDDPLERQADVVADRVMHMSGQDVVQRACKECEEEKKEQPHIQRAAFADSGVGLDVSGAVSAAQRSGAPLPPDVRSFFEPRFGHDFSGVRVHTDGEAARAAHGTAARAYTIGRDIVFGAHEYAPGTAEGRRLLAHELTHVVQQHRVGPGLARSPADKEAAAIGSGIEPLEVKEWRKILEAQGYEVFTKRQFDRVDWLAKAFSDRRARPDLAAINRTTRHVLVGDITAGPWSSTALKPGDVRKLPRDIGAEREERHHLEKTVDNARQAHKHLPEDLRGFSVTARDRWWKEGGYSREITISQGTPAPKPAGGAHGSTLPSGPRGGRSTPVASTPTRSGELEAHPRERKAGMPSGLPLAKNPGETPPTRRPAKAQGHAEPPSHSGGGGRGKLDAGASVAMRTYRSLMGQVSGKMMQIASKNPKAADAIADINKVMDAHAFLQNPKQYTAQFLSDYLINGAFGKFERQLAVDEAQFFSTYPDVRSFYRQSLDDLYKRYDEAVRNLRLPSARKTLGAAFMWIGVTDKTPQSEMNLRKQMINDYLAKQPGIGRYVTRYNDAYKNYMFGLFLVRTQMDNLRQQLGELPAGFADDIRRRGDTLYKVASILDDLYDQVILLSALPGADMALGTFLTLSKGFSGLGERLRIFAYRAGARQSEYNQEITRLEARADQLSRLRGAYDVIYPQSSR